MRQILLILVPVSLVSTLSAFTPPSSVQSNVSSPGDPCNFSYQCLGNCGLDEMDGYCICNFGKCQVDLNTPPEETYECSSFKDCSCRDTPLNCYCDHYGKCHQEPVECQENDDCKRMPKCAGNKCTCLGNSCEHECTTTGDCPNEKYPPSSVSSPGDPCNFTYQCLGNCGLEIVDGECYCNLGKCQVYLDTPPEDTRECRSFKDCSCRDTPLNCYCDILGKCQQEPVECHKNHDCKKMPKCAGKKCTCAGNTCEHECTTTRDCFNEKYQFYCREQGPEYTCKCRKGLCESVDSGIGKICGPLDRWKKDCQYCPDGGSVMIGCKRCSCLKGKLGACTKVGCLPPAHDCGCTKEINMVCGADGNTYSNSCQAECKGAKIKCPGECPCRNNPKCPCEKQWDPTCGVDGKTYANQCLAYCAGVREKCSGPCPCKEG